MSHDVPVGTRDELPPGTRKLVFTGGRSIVVFNVDGTVHAIENSCPHNGASLASGPLDGCILQCPAHGMRFDLTTGCMPGVPGPGGLRLTKLPVTVRDGALFVTDSDPPPV